MDQVLYTLLLQDTRFLLGAESEQATRLRELAESIEDPHLRTLFDEHAAETDTHIDRLQRILADAGEDGEGEIPAAVDGLVEDAEIIADMEFGHPVQDLAIASAARKIEHFEMACYESAIAIAEQLGLNDVLASLSQSLEEERIADRKLATAAVALIKAQLAVESHVTRH